jgi:3-dehydroquinate dehydratase II
MKHLAGDATGLRLPSCPRVTYNRAITLAALRRDEFSNRDTRMAATETIYVLNGPTLNLLGLREPEKYGRETLADVENLCAKTCATFGLKADCRQTNREDELIDFVHEAQARKATGIVINAGGYSHTSIALHDALLAVHIPTVEVHVTNIYARESFRHHPITARAAFATLAGFGIDGYRLAISGLAAKLAIPAKG